MSKLYVRKCTRQQYLNLNKLVNFNFDETSRWICCTAATIASYLTSLMSDFKHGHNSHSASIMLKPRFYKENPY